MFFFKLTGYIFSVNIMTFLMVSCFKKNDDNIK